MVSPDPEEDGGGEPEAEACVALPGAGNVAAVGGAGTGGVPGGAGESVEGGAGAVGGAPVGVAGVGVGVDGGARAGGVGEVGEEEELDGGGGGAAVGGEAVPLAGGGDDDGEDDIAAGPARAVARACFLAAHSYEYDADARRASGAAAFWWLAGGAWCGGGRGIGRPAAPARIGREGMRPGPGRRERGREGRELQERSHGRTCWCCHWLWLAGAAAAGVEVGGVVESTGAGGSRTRAT